MTDAPIVGLSEDPELKAMAEAIQQVPLSISTTRRSGNGLRNADEVARAAWDALMAYRKSLEQGDGG